MTFINSLVTWIMKKRMHQIELFVKYPNEVQDEWFKNLIDSAENTEWGKKYDYKSIENVDHFRQRFPIQTYDTLKPYIERMMQGEQNILWPSEIRWFAKSSGTTSDRSKFIPVSEEAMEECHFKGGKDMITLYCNNRPESQLFTGKTLVLGGSHQISQLNPDTYYGDLSAVLLKNLPLWAEFYRTPELAITLLENYEEKIEKIAQITQHVNVTGISGVPTWNIVLAKRLLELTQKDNLLEIWPNLELYVHGAVSFTPYRDHFKKLIPSDKMYYMETYNASEGFFGIQDQSNSEEMLLMLDYGVFYEFLPIENLFDIDPQTKLLDEVETGVNYALIISTNSGLWRYMIGDTVQFTSLSPFRIRITGRTKHFINAFGEEVIVDNSERALKEACRQTDAIIREYTAAPVYFEGNNSGGHEWIIEFEQQPNNKEIFTLILDETLRKINSDYDAKRFKDMALKSPLIHFAPDGTFYRWLKQKGKLGGQHKVPRLANNREYVDSILLVINKSVEAI